MRRKVKERLERFVQKQIKNYFSIHFREYFLNEIWEKEKRINGEKALKTLPGGLLYYCHFESVLEKMIYLESFEKSEISFIKRFLREGDQFIDIGANTGLFTLHASKIIGNKGTVFAFEPTEKIYTRLLANINLNGFENVKRSKLLFQKRMKL